MNEERFECGHGLCLQHGQTALLAIVSAHPLHQSEREREKSGGREKEREREREREREGERIYF